MKPASVQPVDIVRVDGRTREATVDSVAVERPLEVRVDGEPFSVIMRTPGDDEHLAVGFLVSEGVLDARSDLARITAEAPAKSFPTVAEALRTLPPGGDVLIAGSLYLAGAVLAANGEAPD